jgi:hypothetical protein
MRRMIPSLAALAVFALLAAPLVGADKPATDNPADKPAAEKAAAGAKASADVQTTGKLIPPPPEPEGMVKLFNGKDLTGWEGHPDLWSFKEGVVRGQTTKEHPAPGNTFLIWRGGEVKDFDLRLTFRINSGNSGVQYRSQQADTKNEKNKWVVGGYQAEVENTPGKVGFLYHERGPGKTRGYEGNGNYLCKVGDKVVIDETGRSKVAGSLGDKEAIAASYRKGDWNEYVIIAKGNHLRHYINGVQTVDVTDNDPKLRALSGVLALPLHAGDPMVVEFKDVRIKREGTAPESSEK